MKPFFFAAFPYLALVLAVFFGLYRYFTNRFTYTSLSSQMLENRVLFWGSVPWHYGIIPILLAHLAVGLFPSAARAVLIDPVRRAALESVGFALALFALLGIVVLIARRMPTQSRARAVTSPMDWILLFALAAQAGSGFGVALFQRWGSLWYIDTAVPWFWSIVAFRPDYQTVASLPLAIQFHMVNGFFIILLFPFTRLVHIFTVPITYLWRPYQVFVWNRAPRRLAGNPGSSRRAPVPAPEDDPPGNSGRRRFLSMVSIAAGAVGATIVAIPSVWFLLGLRTPPNVWRTVGKADDFPVGSTSHVAFVDPSPLPWAGVTASTAAWLRRNSDTEFIAFSVNCTHLGCPVRWLSEADLFMCPCHGGVFYANGRVASGPPGRPLSRYTVRVENGMVRILTSPLPLT